MLYLFYLMVDTVYRLVYNSFRPKETEKGYTNG